MLKTYVISEVDVILTLTTVLLLITFILYYRERIGKKYRNSSIKKRLTNTRIELNESEAMALMPKLDILINEHRVYMANDLSLAKLAHQLGTSNKKLSILLNEYLKSNFYDYINRFRIEATKKMLLDKSCPLSIEGIAKECGFKSRSSFYKVFKANVGVTPSVYKRQRKS